MKRIWMLFALVVLVSLGAPAQVPASPFLISDWYLAAENPPDEFSISYGDSIVIKGASTIQADGSTGNKRLYWDLGILAPGTYNLNVKAIKNDPIWGPQESSVVPFTFTKPAPGPLKSPANIRLLK